MVKSKVICSMKIADIAYKSGTKTISMHPEIRGIVTV